MFPSVLSHRSFSVTFIFCFCLRFTAGQGLVLYPQIGDKMDIVCPRADASPGGKEEFYRVYLVSRSQIESCTIDKTDAPLLNCDKPHRDVKFTFKFQEFSPNLWGLEFLRGRDYYITCKSDGRVRPSRDLCASQRANQHGQHPKTSGWLATGGAAFESGPQQMFLVSLFLLLQREEAMVIGSLSICQFAWESKNVASLLDRCRLNQHLSGKWCMIRRASLTM